MHFIYNQIQLFNTLILPHIYGSIYQVQGVASEEEGLARLALPEGVSGSPILTQIKQRLAHPVGGELVQEL